ncbi:MAG: DUF3466 family protein [Photobacterium aquimaris]|nr:DUF3466 family protein [Photobacterium aquimaris]
MPNKILKLSTLAILIAGASQANAAVYTVVPVDQNSTLKDLPYFDNAQSGAPLVYSSTGIQDSGTDASCFTADCTTEAYNVTSKASRGSEGTPIADTTPYNQNSQDITTQSQLRYYCENNLGYGICDSWADNQFFGRDYSEDDVWNGQGLGGLQKKQAAWINGYHSNTQGLVDGIPTTSFASTIAGYDGTQKENLGSIVANTTDSIVKGAVGTDFVYGITSSALFENATGKPRAFSKRGFVNVNDKSVQLAPVTTSNELVSNMGQTQANAAVAMKDGNLLVVGSSSYAPSFYAQDRDGKFREDTNKLPNVDDILKDSSKGLDFNKLKQCAISPSNNLYVNWECQFSTFANEAAFWIVDANGTKTSIAASAITAGSGDNRAGLAVIDKDNEALSFQASAQAVALKGDDTPIAVGYSTADVRDDFYAMQATYFTPKDSSLASWTATPIPGLNIKPGDDRDFTYTMANGVNSSSVIVGDAKGNGTKPQRAFIYQVGQGDAKFFDQLAPSLFFKDSNSNAAAINNNGQVVGWVDAEASNGAEARHRAFTYINGTAQGPLTTGGAWMLDDLTNDGGAANSVANSYRIMNATGINNAGVISATAFYCAGGYENLSQLASCNGDEQQVVVKLVPKNTDAVIQPRAKDEDQPYKRSGGSLGILALTALGFIGFRRRK